MNSRPNETYNERLTKAADAKRAMVEKFRARPSVDDPVVLERQAARKALAEAREARMVARRSAREEKAARLLAEQAAHEADQAARAAEQVAHEAREADRVAAAAAEHKARALALAAQQKAARDARYAARKAR